MPPRGVHRQPTGDAVTDTIFTNVSISGAQRSGDHFDAKSGFGIWANELPEPGQGPAVREGLRGAIRGVVEIYAAHRDVRHVIRYITTGARRPA
ncbi:hypothetical protein GCM10022225_26680 [Plantactinospora mayteni]|uniref:hypothetical protein n=1 Tax=Plantactinospora mayteni TaxID=566021 RepID=UPI0031EB3690